MFPFARFPGVDTVLGPEMRSTGEVIGLDRSFDIAFAKSQLGARRESADLGRALRLGARGATSCGCSTPCGCWPALGFKVLRHRRHRPLPQ